MAIFQERRDWHNPVAVLRPSETPAESPFYITANGKGIDLTLSTYRRRLDVAAHERASLDFMSIDPKLSQAIERHIGPNAINRWTARGLFQRIRRPDIIAVDESGKVRVIGESKISRGERFANEARRKIDWLPNFVDVMILNGTLLVSFLKDSFPQDEVRELVPVRMDFQDASETDLVFLTPHEENERILELIGKGRFRSVTHRTVNSASAANLSQVA